MPPIVLPPDDTLADVVTGGALLTSLINAHSNDSDTQVDMSLCYEIHGQPGTYFNYISGHCLSVNTHYINYDPSRPLNYIDGVGIVATNSLGENINMSIDTNCRVHSYGAIEAGYINSSGVVVQTSSDTVLISTDNRFCGGDRLDVVVYCTVDRYGLMQLHVHRDMMMGDNYHGLLGELA